MLKLRDLKKYFLLDLSVVLLFTCFASGAPAALADPLSNMQKELNGISTEQKKVLEKLFAMSNNIEEMAIEQKQYADNIKLLGNEVDRLKEAISSGQKDYDRKLDVLREVLQIYQKKGPGTYLEIILDSKDLNTLLWRINTMQDLSLNTGKLLKSLEQTSRGLSEKKSVLDEKIKRIKSDGDKLNESLNREIKLKEDMENYLQSLSEQEGYYNEKLKDMAKAWENLKLLFSNAGSEFARILKEGSIPYDAVKIDFTHEGIEGTIDEETFNKIISSSPVLSNMKFSFHAGEVKITVPESDLVLNGTFLLAEDGKLKFEAHDGSFCGMLLDKNTVKELFRDKDIVIDIKSLLNSNLDKFEILDGALKFTISPGM